MKRITVALAAASLLMTVLGTASAAPVAYTLLGSYQRSGGGALSSLAFKSGVAMGCPAAPPFIQPCYDPTSAFNIAQGISVAVAAAGLPTFTWDTVTKQLVQTDTDIAGGAALFWASSFIGSNPTGASVIGDRVENLVIDISVSGTGTTDATNYRCVEGGFLATVGANGCKDINLGTIVTDSTVTTWNAGAAGPNFAKCVTQVINPDDWSLLDGTGPNDVPPGVYTPGTPDPRGLTVQTAGQAGAGCAITTGAFDHWFIIQDSGGILILADVLSLGSCYIFGVTSSSGCPTAALGASYMIFYTGSPLDTDGDGNFDLLDNCSSTANADQQDQPDGDGIGNVCDPDDDNDGDLDVADNCPLHRNADQADTDSDGRGNVCDNCRLVGNNLAGIVPGTAFPKAQHDADTGDGGRFAAGAAGGDGYGNRCDGDINNLSPASGIVNTTDYSIFRSVINKLYTFSGNAAKSDFDSSGTVNTTDYSIFRGLINKVPGPSAYCAPVPLNIGNCPAPVCGNSIIEQNPSPATPGEECDDGNLTPGDGCSEICKL